MYANGNAGVLGTFNSTGTLTVNTDKFTVDGATGNTYVAGNAGVLGTLNSTGTFSVNLDKFTVDGATGNTYVAGNAGVLGTFNSTGTLTVNTDKFTVDGSTGNTHVEGTFNVTGTSYLHSTLDVLGVTTLLDATAGGVGVGALVVANGGASIHGDVYADSTSTAVDAAGGTGALRVAGGVWIGDNLIVKSTSADTGTSSANALYLEGGAWINDALHVVGPAVFDSDVWFNGPTTYVFSTNTVYTDNLLELHTPPGGADDVWYGDDGKDVGLRFHYYTNSTDTNAALVLSNDMHYLEWYESGATGTNIVSNGVYGTFKTGSIKLVDTTVSTNTGSGALTVEGGVGIAGDMYVGGTIHANEIIGFGTVTANVTTATNLQNGAAGQIPIQNGDGSTTFISAGTGDSQVLTWSNTYNTATWQSASGTTVGNATTATNIDGGAQYDVPFQSGYGLTAFDTGVFAYNNTDKSLKINDVIVWGDNANAPGNADVQVAAATGLGVELYSDAYAQLNYNSDVYIYVNGTDGAVLETGNGDYTLILDSSGNVTLGGGVGNGYLEAPTVRANNLVDGRVVLSDSNHELVDNANLTFDGTNLTIGGSGGDITMTNGNITGVNHISATSLSAATLTATSNLYLTALTSDSVPYIGATGQVSEDNTNFTWSAAGNQLHAANITGAILTATTDLFLTALTTGSVPYIGVDGEVSEDSTNFTWSAAGNQLQAANITGAILTATTDLFLTALTQNSVPYIGAAGEVSEDNTNFTWDAVGLQLHAANITGAVLTATNNVYISGSDASSTNTATAGALQVTGGVGIAGGLYVDQDAYVNADLYVQGTLYVQGNSLDGVDTITGSTGTFIDLVSTGTIFANDLKANTFAVNTFTAVTVVALTVISTSTSDANLYTYGYDLAGVDAGIKTAGGIKALGNVSVGKVLYTGMNDAGDVSGESPEGKTIDGVFITNSMQAGGTYNSISSTSTQTLDSWDKTVYTSAKYMIQVMDSGNIHTQELMVIQDGTDVYISEYGIVTNNGELGVFDGVISGANVLITFTPTSATSMTIQVVRQSILTGIENYC